MTRWSARAAAASLTCAMVGVAGAARGQVLLRGGEHIDAKVEKVWAGGVAVAAEPGRPARTISWARVRTVEGESAGEAEAFAAVSDGAWRALSRLDRGDFALAEPAIEALFAQRLPAPTGSEIAQGLLRCRLRRGAPTAAIPVWLECLRVRTGDAVETGPRADPLRSIDADTLLVPALPPIFLDTPAVRAFASSPADAPAASSDTAAALAALYHFAAARACGLPANAPPETHAKDAPGVALARSIVLAQCGEKEERAKVRGELTAGLEKDAGTWREAWRRAALGRSLLREDSQTDRRKGVLELLHLPARFSTTMPYLAGLALAEASAELAAEGETSSAVALRTELESEYPGHPALSLAPSRGRAP